MTMQLRTRHTPKPEPIELWSAIEACDMATRFVRIAGFQHRYTSMKSEALYFSFPGRHGVLRIAMHGKGGKNEWGIDGPTLVSITFPRGNLNGRLLTYTPLYVENAAANAIGLFLIRSEAMPAVVEQL